jgi:Mut7-C RNAse domain
MREQAENLDVEDEAGWGGRRDRDLVEQAHAEDRILLTRDRRVVEIRRAGGRTIVLRCGGIDACASELARHLTLEWTLDPLSRCTLCNTRLELADDQLVATLPPHIRALRSTVNTCPFCGRLGWQPCPPYATAAPNLATRRELATQTEDKASCVGATMAAIAGVSIDGTGYRCSRPCVIGRLSLRARPRRAGSRHRARSWRRQGPGRRGNRSPGSP